jgi:hypothetical protein
MPGVCRTECQCLRRRARVRHLFGEPSAVGAALRRSPRDASPTTRCLTGCVWSAPSSCCMGNRRPRLPGFAAATSPAHQVWSQSDSDATRSCLMSPGHTIAAELAAAAVPDAQPRGIARAINAEGDGWLAPGHGPGKPLGKDALRQDLTNCRSGLDPAGTPPCSPLPGTYPDGPVRPPRRWLQYRRTMARLRRRRVRHLRLNWSLLRLRSSPRSRSVPATGSWGAKHLDGCRTGRGYDHTSEPARGAVQGALR